MAESTDRGQSWSEPVGIDPGPAPAHVDKVFVGPQVFCNIADGAIVLLAYGSHDLHHPDIDSFQWGGQHWQAFTCRSTDDGRTW